MENDYVFGRCGTLLEGEDLDGGFVGMCLDLDGAAVGVVVAEGGREGEEPGLGVLGGEAGGQDKEESEEGDGEGEVEPEGEGVVVAVGGWRRRGFEFGFAGFWDP